MSIELVSLALAMPLSPASHKLALVKLAEGANSSTGDVWNSRATVAECVGVNPREAHRILSRLIEMGLIEVVGKRKVSQTVWLNVYRVNAQRMRELAPQVIHRGGVQTTPKGGVQTTPEKGEGWRTGAEWGGVQTTQTVIEPLIQGAAVDNFNSESVTEPKNSRQQESDGRLRPERERLQAVRNRLNNAVVVPYGRRSTAA